MVMGRTRGNMMNVRCPVEFKIRSMLVETDNAHNIKRHHDTEHLNEIITYARAPEVYNHAHHNYKERTFGNKRISWGI